ncbi:MAG: MBL fold metallo-hydrolase, partial [Pseudomonadales bacterium]|nr:MBL fold metallo-hydrolase [Pseudomonadales bacterium]
MLKHENYQAGQITQCDDPVPKAGELIELAAGVFWCRMPLPISLNHINLYLIDEGDSWTIIDTGMHLPDTLKAWEIIFSTYCVDKPI